MVETVKSVRLFYCYSRQDKELRDQLSIFLGRSHIVGWHDREVPPGKDWADEIDANLNAVRNCFENRTQIDVLLNECSKIEHSLVGVCCSSSIEAMYATAVSSSGPQSFTCSLQ